MTQTIRSVLSAVNTLRIVFYDKELHLGLQDLDVRGEVIATTAAGAGFGEPDQGLLAVRAETSKRENVL